MQTGSAGSQEVATYQVTDSGNHTLPGPQGQPLFPPAGVVLVGFRATGKSTVGRIVARRLGLRFVDMDEVLASRHGPIDRQVTEGGWPLFRERERRLLAELAAENGLVLATGGGAVLHRDLWPQIRQRFLVVWLHVPSPVIEGRLVADRRTAGQRPSLTGDDPVAEAARLLAERRPLYRAASHLQVDGTRAPEVVAEQIAALFRPERAAGRAGGQHRER